MKRCSKQDTDIRYWEEPGISALKGDEESTLEDSENVPGKSGIGHKRKHAQLIDIARRGKGVGLGEDITFQI